VNQSDAAQSSTSPDVGDAEARRRDASMKQLSHRRLLQGRPSILDPSRMSALKAKGPLETRFSRRDYTYAEGVRPGDRTLPVQTAVNRTDRLEAETIDIEIRDPDGKVVQILRFPVFGRYGRDVNDPGHFSELVDPRTAICAVLAPYAVARCLAQRGLW
jgi:hypothetical protein